MPKANYGIFGSLAPFAFLATIMLLSLFLVVFTGYLRQLFLAIFVISVMGLAIFLALMIYISRRTGIASKVIEAGKITSNDRILDVGTGRGFLAIEIAKAVEGCRIIGIDVWNMQAKGQMHKGFVIGNSKENAEKNAVLEGVADRVEFRQCDARKMPFESEFFDVVVSSLALHQMIYFGANSEKVLDEIYRVLKPGGRIVNVDFMIGKRVTEELRELGFRNLEVTEVRRPGPLPFVLKMLSATKTLCS